MSIPKPNNSAIPLLLPEETLNPCKEHLVELLYGPCQTVLASSVSVQEGMLLKAPGVLYVLLEPSGLTIRDEVIFI